jgi:hypothetical protein
MKRRTEGFAGQIIHFFPQGVVAETARHPLGIGVHATCTGWFPKALGA